MADAPSTAAILLTFLEAEAANQRLANRLEAIRSALGNSGTEHNSDFSKTSFDTSAMAVERWARQAASAVAADARRLAAGPDHVTSVTVALGCTLVLDVIGVQPDLTEPVITLSLRAEGGTAIGVPTVAVDQLRKSGVVL